MTREFVAFSCRGEGRVLFTRRNAEFNKECKGDIDLPSRQMAKFGRVCSNCEAFDENCFYLCEGHCWESRCELKC